MPAQFRIDQATPGAGVAGRSRHDLISGEVITLTATDPAAGPGVTFTWEIIDRRGSSAVLSSTTGTSVTIGSTSTRPFAFLIQLTATTPSGTSVVRRIASSRAPLSNLRPATFPETAPDTQTLDLHVADDSTDNALYTNRSGTGVSEQNWSGWAEWAWEVVGAIESLAGSVIPYPRGTYTVPSGVAVGDVVYINGSNTATQASNAAIGTALTIPGIVVSKPTSTTAVVAYAGEHAVYSGLTPGAVYYLGTAGAITATPPTTPGQVVRRIGYAKNATTLMLSVGEPFIL